MVYPSSLWFAKSQGQAPLCKKPTGRSGDSELSGAGRGMGTWRLDSTKVRRQLWGKVSLPEGRTEETDETIAFHLDPGSHLSPLGFQTQEPENGQDLW